MEANIKIRNSGVPNFIGEKIRAQSKFNLQKLDMLLKNYHDRRILKFLMYGFPIDHDGSDVTHNLINHKGVGSEFEVEIEQYLKKEISEGAVLGPLGGNPFEPPIAVSPLNSVSKKESTARRVILDLSFPQGRSVNNGIKADTYLGE